MERRIDGARSKPAGGFALFAVGGLFALWWLRKLGVIQSLDFRAFFALLEMQERRCGAPAGRDPEYSLRELSNLCGGAKESELNGSLRRLERAGFVKRFTRTEIILARGAGDLALDDETRAVLDQKLELLRSPGRLVPFPRRMARLLASGTRATFAGAILGTAIAALFYRRGVVTSRGAYKAGWLADAFGLSERTVYRHRAHLARELGWIRVVDSHQLEQNARGLLIEVDLDWEHAASIDPDNGAGEAQQTSTGAIGPAVCQAPRAENAPDLSAPKDLYKEPFQEELNNKPAQGGGSGSGIYQPKIRDSNPEGVGNKPRPSLRRVIPDDLKDPQRLLALHGQAVREGIVSDSEHDQLQFFAAAERARTVGSKNPPGLFVRIVRSGLWRFLSQDDEDAARRKLRRLLHPAERGPREVAPSRPIFGVPEDVGRKAEVDRRKPSEDAFVVRAATSALRLAGYRRDLFHAFKSQYPEWTRDRWERAAAEWGRSVG